MQAKIGPVLLNRRYTKRILCSFREVPEGVERQPIILTLELMIVGVVTCHRGTDRVVRLFNPGLEFERFQAQVCKWEDEVCLLIRIGIGHIKNCLNNPHRLQLSLIMLSYHGVTACPYGWMKTLKNKALKCVEEIQHLY